MTRVIYFQPAGENPYRLPTAPQLSPEGHDLAILSTPWHRGFDTLLRSDFIYHIFFGRILDKLLPVHLVKVRITQTSRIHPCPSPRSVGSSPTRCTTLAPRATSVLASRSRSSKPTRQGWGRYICWRPSDSRTCLSDSISQVEAKCLAKCKRRHSQRSLEDRTVPGGVGLFACNRILFNHESPRRGGTFVTHRSTRGIAAILAKKMRRST